MSNLKVLTRDMLYITGPGSIQSGVEFSLTIEARDSFGRLVTDYTAVSVLVIFADDEGTTLGASETHTLTDGTVTFSTTLTLTEAVEPIIIEAHCLEDMGVVRGLTMEEHYPYGRREFALSTVPVWPAYIFTGEDPMVGGSNIKSFALLNALDELQDATPEEYVQELYRCESKVEVSFYSPAANNSNVAAINYISVGNIYFSSEALSSEWDVIFGGSGRSYMYPDSVAYAQGVWTLRASFTAPISYADLTSGTAVGTFDPSVDPDEYGDGSFWWTKSMSDIRAIAAGVTSGLLFYWFTHDTNTVPRTDLTVHPDYVTLIRCGSFVSVTEHFINGLPV